MSITTTLALVDSIQEQLAFLPPWARVVVLLVSAVLGAKLFDIAALRVFPRLVKRTETAYDDILIEELHFPITATITLGGVYIAAQTFPAAIQADWFDLVHQGMLTIVLALWLRTVNRVGNRILSEASNGDYSYSSFAPVFSNLFTFALLIGGLFAVLQVWHVDITPLMASAGVAGIAVGFAAKDTVANFFGGLALYFDRTYKIGDYVVLDSGEAGTVVKVGIRSTTIKTRDDVMVTVPNSVLNAATIRNQSAPNRRKRIKVSVGVAYGTDIDQLEEILFEIATDEDLILDSPRPRVRFLSFGDSALEYDIRCWVATPTRATKARHKLNRTIYQRFEEAGIEIPFPQREITIHGSASGPDAEPSVEPVEGTADD